MWDDWWTIPLGVVVGAVLIWAVLVVVLWLTKPGDYDIKEALRLLPDLVRLVKGLATDPATPRGVRIRLALLLVYLALPIDLIPDFIPVLGYAADAIIVAIALRSVGVGRSRVRRDLRRSAAAVVLLPQPGGPGDCGRPSKGKGGAERAWPQFHVRSDRHLEVDGCATWRPTRARRVPRRRQCHGVTGTREPRRTRCTLGR